MKFIRDWSCSSVREACVRCGWYTCGTSQDYESMLAFVDSHKPTDCNITKVAEDIFYHSTKNDGRTLELVAEVLAYEAIRLVAE